MKKTFKEIKSQLPSIESEKVEVLSDELDRILAVKRIWTSDDGKELLKTLKQNCNVALRQAIIAAKKGDSQLSIARILDYSSNIDLLATIQDISIEKEIRGQLEDAVKEAYQE